MLFETVPILCYKLLNRGLDKNTAALHHRRPGSERRGPAVSRDLLRFEMPGKKVVWLRYHNGVHGGPHTAEERKDMYNRILEWYDKYLKMDAGKTE
ncbi:MAG: hypothetical protein PVI11_04055 [Candidatus Aminicenantes bacterium]